MFYDLEKHERCWILPLGSFGAISYERLAELISAAGEIRPDERITHLQIRNDALHFRVERSACLEADTLILLPGWEKSKGVSAEKALAENCGLEILEWPSLPEEPR